MIYRALADLAVGVHFLFLLYVVGGALLVRRARWLAVPHLLCVAWGVYVEVAPGLVCPLTPIENHFATLAGQAGYQGSFIEHYLLPVIYPEGLTREGQWALALLAVVTNALIYGFLSRHRRRPSVRMPR
jgi:hypothetical protein